MQTTIPLLEVCCGNLASACAAAQAGAARIELCSALSVGGLTPSAGLLASVRSRFPSLRIHVLIRPREGNFVYSPDEIDEMCRDIRHAAAAGADGIVSGALLPDREIDREGTARLIDAAENLPFTFHRAFDYVKSPVSSIETLIELGCTRVLTSGGKSSAPKGAEVLKNLGEIGKNRIIILPGGGITPLNVQELLQKTGCTEVHASCSHRVMPTSEGGPALGASDDGSYLVSDAAAVREMLQAISRVSE